jgi:beta-galactosidase GanA
VDFIEPQRLESHKYKVIIAPWHLIGKKETCDRLQEFVEAGGTLLIETGFGTYDDHMVFNPVVPPFGLADVFGYREQESLYMLDAGQTKLRAENLPISEHVYLDGHLTFSEPVTATIKAHTFLTPITITSAKVIATYDSTPVAATRKVGKGQVFYVGTNLGAAIEDGDRAGIDLVRAMVTQVVSPAVTSDKVRPRLVETPAGSLLIVFNEQITDQRVSIKVPARYKQAIDLYDNQPKAIHGNSIDMVVPFEGVSVFRVS